MLAWLPNSCGSTVTCRKRKLFLIQWISFSFAPNVLPILSQHTKAIMDKLQRIEADLTFQTRHSCVRSRSRTLRCFPTLWEGLCDVHKLSGKSMNHCTEPGGGDGLNPSVGLKSTTGERKQVLTEFYAFYNHTCVTIAGSQRELSFRCTQEK